MPFPRSHARRLPLLVALAVGAAGCGPATPPQPAAPPPAAVHDHDHDHDHDGHDHGDHDHPETLAAGIAQLAQAAADVKAHLAGGANEAADDVVHGVGHLIEDVQGLLSKEPLSADAKEAATKALDEIFECFDKLDTALHAPAGTGQPPAEVHAGVADRIEAAIKSLEELR